MAVVVSSGCGGGGDDGRYHGSECSCHHNGWVWLTS